MAIKNLELAKLSLDVYNGVQVNFNNVKGEDAIRNALVQSVGGEWNYYNFQKNKWDFYQVLTDVLTLPMQQTIEGMFDGLVDFETINLGDVKVYDVENPDLFKVATIASGNNDIRRQRLYGRKIKVETEKKGIKIYEDFDRFVAGKINWTKLVDKCRTSMSLEYSNMIYGCLMSNYAGNGTQTKYSKYGTFSEATLDEMIARIEGKLGMKVALWGTKQTLAKISTGTTSVVATVGASDRLKEDMANFGYFKNYKGTPMIELPQAMKVGTDDFAFEDTDLFILPVGEKIIKFVTEGDVLISDNTEATTRNDQQIEFLMEQKVGVACLLANYFGIYRLA